MSDERPARGIAAEEVLGKAADARLIRRLWRYVKPHWRLLLLGLFLIPIGTAFELAQPYVFKLAIEQNIQPGVLEGLGALALLAVGLALMQSLTQFAQLYVLQLLGQRAMHDLRRDTYRHVLAQRSAFFDRMPVGRLLTRLTNDVENINESFVTAIVPLLADLFKLVAIVVVMAMLSPKLTLMTFVTLPLLLILVNYARKIMRTSFRLIRVKVAAMNAHLAEHLAGVKVVQLFAREQAASAEYNQLNAEYRDGYLASIKADATMYALVEAIGVASTACIAWYAGGNLAEGLTVGLVVAFVEYVNKFFIPVRDLSAKYAAMQSAMAATERIVRLLDTHEPDAPPRSEARPPVARPDAPHVRFSEVHFGYRPREPVLRGVSLDVARGRNVAVVGATGSGKSTLIKLLARLYEIDGGTIEVDGVDVRDLPPEELRRRITVVSQDVFLFAGTVADNVRLGNPDASDAEIEQALARVGADRMLARRGTGIDEQVAERGSNFSAGERQLIAFARAMVRDPEILVLDEATAHVDPEAEEWIERAVAELMKGRTTLVIAHRLSTIRNADQILVMARGNVIERGTHDELVASGGAYAKLERTFSRKD